MRWTPDRKVQVRALVVSIVLCSWARHFTLAAPLSTKEYKWVPANCQENLMKCWGVTCDGLASHPGGVAILLVASCYGNRDKLRRCGPLGSCANFTFAFYLYANCNPHYITENLFGWQDFACPYKAIDLILQVF